MKHTKERLTISEAASYCAVSRSTVIDWITRKILPCEELPSRGKGRYHFRRIRIIDLEKFLNEHYNQIPKNPKIKTDSKIILISPDT